jgi:acetyl esterase/lipase
MPFSIDTEVAAAIGHLIGPSDIVNAPVGDVMTRRRTVEALLARAMALTPAPDDIVITEFAAFVGPTAIPLRWYTKRDERPQAAVVFLHGGGMMMGSAALYDNYCACCVSASGVGMLSVDYRYAPEFPGLIPVEDCYAALCWLNENAAVLGVSPDRVAVMGDSAGGGLAAGTALLSRDRNGPHLARQILIYPMLDDRTTVPDPALRGLTSWSYADNATGWGALLGPAVGGPDVSPYCAPARAVEVSGLPPAYIDVGELDIFCAESVEYAGRLNAAAVSVELHVRPGVPHGFDVFAPNADITGRAWADRYRVLRSL